MLLSKLTRPTPQRHGLTLIELMIALAVISLLAGIALPTVKNSLREQRVARGASLLQSAIEDGRARSILAGGGGGIIIDRIGNETIDERSNSVQIRLANTPPPYTGDVSNAVAKMGVNLGGTANPDNDVITLWFDTSAAQMIRSATDYNNGAIPSLINYGDKIHVGDASLPMTITDIAFGTVASRNAAGLLASDIPDADVSSWVRVEVQRPEVNLNLTRFIGQDVSFSITRSPQPAIALPIEMPKGTVIDLTASGIGRFGNQFSPMAIDGNYTDETIVPYLTGTRDYQSIYILFGSRGEISRVLAGQVTTPGGTPVLSELPITGDVHFLVGQGGEVKTSPAGQLEDTDTDPLGDEAKDGTTPLLDYESIWVSIRSRNGDVAASPLIDPTDDTTPLIPATASNPPTDNALQETRIQTVIGLTRSAAVESRDLGSL